MPTRRAVRRASLLAGGYVAPATFSYVRVPWQGYTGRGGSALGCTTPPGAVGSPGPKLSDPVAVPVAGKLRSGPMY